MNIQNLVLPSQTDKSEQELYVRLNNTLSISNRAIEFAYGGKASFDTYFNAFSSGKWSKYTIIENLQLLLEIKGEFEVLLFHAIVLNNKLVRNLIKKENVKTKEKEIFDFDFGKLRDSGVFYFEIKALKENSKLYSGNYETVYKEVTQQVKIAIDICTFKREEYVKRNVSLLCNEILNNKNSVLYNKIIVNISDNASSLNGVIESNEFINLMPNANLGGVGGFTRGIIETKQVEKEKDISHLLIMDDDASISISAIEKTYILLSYLKEKYFDYTIGGELLRLDKLYIQYEAGALWNQGNIKALKHLIDLRKFENVVLNEIEEKAEYAGWWYCCIPLSQIDMNSLPLPIFIHRDDIEYGIRVCKGKFIYMNGISIWHESFEGKMPGVLEYYDIRNLAILNSIHFHDYTKRKFKRFLLKWVCINAAKYRYKYIDYNLKAVEDFCKGIDWLLVQDGEVLHKELMGINYKSVKFQEYIGYKGLKSEDFNVDFDEKCKLPFVIKALYLILLNGYLLKPKNDAVVTTPSGNVYKLFRAKEVLVVDAYYNTVYLKRSLKELFKTFKKLIKMFKIIDENYDIARESYRNRYKELTNIKFWRTYLGI